MNKLITKLCSGGCGIQLPLKYKEGPSVPWKKTADLCLKCQGKQEALDKRRRDTDN